jgi:UDP-N-acetylmuramoyl-tripeptide--D-alanyl-D-alanine ligase
MAEYTLAEVIAASGGLLLQNGTQPVFSGISTDSRLVQPGEVFIALKGENFNGHDFLLKAASLGAAALMIMDELPLPTGPFVIKVSDTLKALGDLARFHRHRFGVPVIGITGSNGKTTTKDLLASILQQEFSLVKTEANFNNEIGLPLTLFKMNRQTQAVVVEMGMRGLGQISNLAGIAEPDFGIVTNVGLTHLELLGSQHNIARAKAELVQSLPKNGLAVLNGDDPLVREMASATNARVVLYGIEGSDLHYRAGEIEMNESGSQFTTFFQNTCLKLTLPIPGRHNILNALGAIAVAKELGVLSQAIQRGLAEPVLTGKRLNFIEKNGYHLIDDTYNASPTSVKAAIDVLVAAGGAGQRKIAVLADMLELGPTTLALHHELGVYAAKSGVDSLFAFGDLAKEYANGMNETTHGAEYFSNKQALIDRLKAYIKPGDFILIKGSRGMKMEEIVNALATEEVHF